MPSKKLDMNVIMGHIKRAISQHKELKIEYDRDFGEILIIIGDLDKIYIYYEKLMVTCMLCKKTYSKKGVDRWVFTNLARRKGWLIGNKNGPYDGEVYCPDCKDVISKDHS